MQTRFRSFPLIAGFMATVLLSGCQTLGHREEKAPEPPPPPPIQSPVATHAFTLAPDDDVIGELQVTTVQGEDTLPDIARRFNLGYEEIVRANPGIDPWLPGAGREIVLPTQFVLPKAPREGLVINLAQLRVYYFPKVAKGEPQPVITHPIGIGKVGWSTPEGTTKITGKRKNPTWFPPASVRKEHREAGDPLPAKVPPGPDNPLGAHMMTLGWPSYLVHGTNKPYGVGLRSSHGCIRFYPEDIAQLFDAIPVGTKVTVVNQPFVFGWHDDSLYAQVFPKLEDDDREHPQAAQQLLNVAISDDMWKRVQEHNATVDLDIVNSLVSDRRGIALPISHGKLTLDEFVATARHVENKVPEGATWDGSEQTLFTAEEFEAAKTGTILPKKPAPAKQTKKTRAAAKSVPAATGSTQ
ncbi:MAG TPA: L,D-transpeptidase family protein [Steroidobacteraceae bacterium]|nr:L,D-transpeptidase family protein [Steroidobacteraceae bacterium]